MMEQSILSVLSDVFRGQRKGALGINGLKALTASLESSIIDVWQRPTYVSTSLIHRLLRFFFDDLKFVQIILFFIPVLHILHILHILRKYLQSPGIILFWCIWESTSENLSKSQLYIGILTLNILNFAG